MFGGKDVRFNDELEQIKEIPNRYTDYDEASSVQPTSVEIDKKKPLKPPCPTYIRILSYVSYLLFALCVILFFIFRIIEEKSINTTDVIKNNMKAFQISFGVGIVLFFFTSMLITIQKLEYK
jgi:hypothetical protein